MCRFSVFFFNFTYDDQLIDSKQNKKFPLLRFLIFTGFTQIQTTITGRGFHFLFLTENKTTRKDEQGTR